MASSGARPRVSPEHDLHATRTFQKGRRAGHAKPGHAGPWRQPAKTTIIYPRAEADLVHMGLHTRRTCWRDRNRLPRGGPKPPLPLSGEDPSVSRGCRAVRIIAAVTQGSGRSERAERSRRADRRAEAWHAILGAIYGLPWASPAMRACRVSNHAVSSRLCLAMGISGNATLPMPGLAHPAPPHRANRGAKTRA